MNKIITIFILIICCRTLFAQDKITEELKILIDKEEYNKIIDLHNGASTDYSAKSLYYIGYAYYMKEDDLNCIKFMDLSINNDSEDPAPHFLKGSTLNYMGKYPEAIISFENAIIIEPKEAEFYSGIGDAYYQLENFELALKNYKKATEQINCPDRPYSMVAQIYSDQKQNEKALEAFYTAKSKIDKNSNSYLNALFNIGLFESKKGDFNKAEQAYTELLEIKPDDYHSYAKLIQVYYHKKEYNKAKPLKDKLYEAHQKGLVKDNLKDMFCFDQFEWKGYLIQVFERYESGNKDTIYNKHLFYVVDNSDKVVLRVQTEFSPISIELGGPKYLLCANKGVAHYNPGIGFNDDVKYDDLKAAAIKLFEMYMK